MLTQRQINKIEKSMENGTGSDIKISRTQIRRSVKHGGNLFTSLTSLGTKLLPFAMRGVSKVAPALATGAASALGETGFKKNYLVKEWLCQASQFQKGFSQCYHFL